MSEKETNPPEQDSTSTNRRDFLKGSGAVAGDVVERSLSSIESTGAGNAATADFLEWRG